MYIRQSCLMFQKVVAFIKKYLKFNLSLKYCNKQKNSIAKGKKKFGNAQIRAKTVEHWKKIYRWH